MPDKGDLREKSGKKQRFNGSRWSTLCSHEGCGNQAIKGGVCCKHGVQVIVKRCSIEGCENGARKGGICCKHGSRVKKCSHEGCENNAIKGGICVSHGAREKVKKCSHEDCENQAKKGGKCIAHGGGNRCPNCIDWIDSRVGWKKYDGYCATCFKRVFPDDPRSTHIYEKTKEIKVRNWLNEHFKGFIPDKVLWSGNCKCTHRRRIDFRKLIGNTMLCIEVDERQHSTYLSKDEEIRYDDLDMVFSGKWIFIRFNPDSFINKKGKRVNPELDKRFNILKEEIEKQINRIENEENTEPLEIIKLFFNF